MPVRFAFSHRRSSAMPHCTRLVVLASCFLVLGTAPLHAQETDSLATDTADAPTPATDTSVTDTMAAETVMPDTTEGDTMGVDTTATYKARRKAIRQARRDSLIEVRTQQARTAAESWLTLTDAGRFDESWDAADSTLQKSISRENWIDQGRRSRNRLDTMRSRKLARSVYRDSTDLFPGQRPVVTFQYTTEFDRGKTLEAVVTAKRDTAWKVAGYRVVPAPSPDTARADTTEADTTETSSSEDGEETR